MQPLNLVSLSLCKAFYYGFRPDTQSQIILIPKNRPPPANLKKKPVALRFFLSSLVSLRLDTVSFAALLMSPKVELRPLGCCGGNGTGFSKL